MAVGVEDNHADEPWIRFWPVSEPSTMIPVAAPRPLVPTY